MFQVVADSLAEIGNRTKIADFEVRIGHFFKESPTSASESAVSARIADSGAGIGNHLRATPTLASESASLRGRLILA